MSERFDTPEKTREVIDEKDLVLRNLRITQSYADLGDRMGYIVDFFRSRQREGDLFRPPFDPRQTEAIRAGTVPPGRL